MKNRKMEWLSLIKLNEVYVWVCWMVNYMFIYQSEWQRIFAVLCRHCEITMAMCAITDQLIAVLTTSKHWKYIE